MEKCKCRVCTVGDYIKETYGMDTWEDWSIEGMDLEANMKHADLEYELHFNLEEIDKKYCKKNTPKILTETQGKGVNC